jgi:DNA repair exonuclease SbcCD nuclease subunit
MDSRKFTNHIVLNEWKRRFFDELKKRQIEFHMVLGNHDIATKNTVSINSPKLFFAEYDNIKIYEFPTEVKFGKLDVLMVPWICLENHMECELMLNESKALWTVGHFEIDGFEMHRGQTHCGGKKLEAFRRFEQVVSGHFHTRSENGNIKYVGTPYEMTWIDYGDPKGFHVFDTVKRELEFVQNEFTIFNKLFYNDKDQGSEYFKGFDVESLKDTYLKIVVVNKTDPYQFDRLLDKIYQIGVADLKIIEDMSDLESDAVDDDGIEMQDTISLIESYVDQVDTNLDNKKMKSFMKTLYTEALEVMV